MRKLLFVGLVSCLLTTLGFAVNSAVAQVRTVGVSEGEWFKYSHAFDWSSTDPNATMPSYYELMSEMDWTLISITDVSGTNVTFQRVIYLKNGTERAPEVGLTDLDTGQGNATMWVVSANLNPNDAVYTSGDYSAWKINETTVRTYPDGIRDTNRVNLTMEGNVTGIYMYTSQNFYWDRATGVVVEMAIIQTYQTNVSQTDMLSIITITESNAWVIPEFSTWAPTLLILIILTICIVIYKRRLFKTLACEKA